MMKQISRELNKTGLYFFFLGKFEAGLHLCKDKVQQFFVFLVLSPFFFLISISNPCTQGISSYI